MFSDDDLKKLKERLNAPILSATDDRAPVDLSENDTRALLHRLECAEDLASCADRNEFKTVYEAWRTAAGKNKSALDGGKP